MINNLTQGLRVMAREESLPVNLAEDVENKGFHVEIQGLVVQKKFCEQAKILTVELVIQAINLRMEVNNALITYPY